MHGLTARNWQRNLRKPRFSSLYADKAMELKGKPVRTPQESNSGAAPQRYLETNLVIALVQTDWEAAKSRPAHSPFHAPVHKPEDLPRPEGQDRPSA
jgi:hypothetical protein